MIQLFQRVENLFDFANVVQTELRYDICSYPRIILIIVIDFLVSQLSIISIIINWSINLLVLLFLRFWVYLWKYVHQYLFHLFFLDLSSTFFIQDPEDLFHLMPSYLFGLELLLQTFDYFLELFQPDPLLAHFLNLFLNILIHIDTLRYKL